jgi:hypothetical protein
MVKVVSMGTHSFPQMFVCSPFPILQNNPSSIRSCEPKILLHTNDGLEPIFASKMELFAQYYAFIIFYAKLSRNFYSRQHYFVRRALLKQKKSWNPILPLAFDSPILLQHFQ